MSIVEHSPARLILEDWPWVIGVIAIGAALAFLAGSMTLLAEGEVFGGVLPALVGAGVPLLIAARMVQRVRLTLDRSAGRITRTCRSVRGLAARSFPLPRLAGRRCSGW